MKKRLKVKRAIKSSGIRGAFDANCFKCKAHIGWVGDLIASRPPCPKCGYQLTNEELEVAGEVFRVIFDGQSQSKPQ
jgi:hypothetical protein